MEAIVKRLPAKLVSTIVIILLIVLIVLVFVAVYRGQSIELWGLKIGESKRIETSKTDSNPSANNSFKDKNSAGDELLTKCELEISALKKALNTESNMRVSQEKKIHELEHDLKVNRESLHNELKGKMHSIQMKLGGEEIELRQLQEKYEVTAKKYYPLQKSCEDGESFYRMECKEAGELRGSLEAIKLKIDFVTKSIENNRTDLNLLLVKSTEI